VCACVVVFFVYMCMCVCVCVRVRACVLSWLSVQRLAEDAGWVLVVMYRSTSLKLNGTCVTLYRLHIVATVCGGCVLRMQKYCD